MLSHSAIVKLKAILVIDFIIIGAVAGAYFYLNNQGMIATGAKPANFTLKNLIIDPPIANVSDAVQISVNVTNTGDLEGNKTLDFVINNETKYTQNITLAGGASEIVQYTDIENTEGNYSVSVGDLTGMFTINPAPPGLSKIVLSNIVFTPYEAWPDQPVNVTATAENPTDQADKLTVRVKVDDTFVETRVIQLNASTTQTILFTVNATEEGMHNVKLNTLSSSFLIVKNGYHSLIINRSGGGSLPLTFTLNGVTYNTPYNQILPVGDYAISVPNPFSVGTGVLAFSYWQDGNSNPSRTVKLSDKPLIMVATYTLISGYASCPSLYMWNGTGYSYVTDVSNPGWLGYISYINSDGQIVFGGGNPWDYVKLDNKLLATNNGNFDMTLSQQWDELYYLDSANMIVVDHPIGTDVYTSMTNYLNKGSTGQIYTVSTGALLSPISATNEKGQNVLAQIAQQDGVYTPGINGAASQSWDNISLNKLTLDLGNLSAASQVKLVITGMVDWGPADTYYAWINSFKEAASQGLVPNGTQITPAPTLEIRDSNGNWVGVSQDKEIPLPSDYNARTFTMDLTGLFPANVSDYQVRFTNFWNVTYDYIGIDTTPQQDITIQKISPISAVLSQLWDTQSNSSGAFTRYGDVTPLLQNADDMFVIGRQGDQVNIQFSTSNLTALAPGMERDYFFSVACWFKDPPGGWGYGFNFTVIPLPFMAMSGFPYASDQSYPYDATHLAYIAQYNTRVISAP